MEEHYKFYFYLISIFLVILIVGEICINRKIKNQKGKKDGCENQKITKKH